MIFHQPNHDLCLTSLTTVSLSDCDITISYAEEHDEHTVEFSHKHPDYEIIYVIDGSISVILDHDEEQLNCNEFLFLNKQVDHYIVYKPSTSYRYLNIIFSVSPAIRRHTGDHPSKPADSKSNQDLVSFFQCIKGHKYVIYKDLNNSVDYINKMYKEVQNSDWGWSYQLQCLFASFILSILKNFIRHTSELPRDNLDNIPIAITKFLHANYPNPLLSVSDIADHFHISIRHVDRLFKEYFGNSPTKTLTTYRLNYAKDYIQKTDYTLETIAEKVGFSSSSVLCRLFKEAEGITISQYKRQLKKNQQKTILPSSNK